MSESLTQAQKDFVQGSKLFGCSFLQTLTMLAMLWHPADLGEVMMYMADNLDATPAQLYDVCVQISSKRPDPPDFDEQNFLTD